MTANDFSENFNISETEFNEFKKNKKSKKKKKGKSKKKTDLNSFYKTCNFIDDNIDEYKSNKDEDEEYEYEDEDDADYPSTEFSDNDSGKRKLSYEIIKYLTSVLSVKYFNNNLYIYNGEYHEFATQSGIIGLLQEILPEKDLRLLSHRNLRDAADLLLSRRLPNHDTAKIKKHCVMFKNGLFNVKKWKFVEPSDENIILMKLDFPFYPDEKMDAPTFDAFLSTCCSNDKQVIQLTLEVLGYCLLPENSAKSFFVFGTAPNTGKSTIAKLLRKIVGNRLISDIALNDLSGAFDMSSNLGKTLNISMDLDSERLNSRAVRIIKNITGDDVISINIKFQPFNSYLSTSKFIFGTNHRIYIPDQDDAFWNRLVMVPFMNSVAPENQDKNLDKKLWKEINGIMNRILKAAQQLILNNYVFSTCSMADDIVYSWRYGKDPSVESFVRNCCNITGKSNIRTHSADLYDAYKKYCDERNFEAVSMKQFSTILNLVFNLKKGRWVGEDNRSLHGFSGINLD